MRHRLRTATLGLAIAGLAALAVNGAGSRPIAATPPVQDPGHGSCDADGVDAHYVSSWHASPAPGAFRVDAVEVRNVAQTCEDGQVFVRLRQGTTELTTGIQDVPNGGGTVVVPVTPLPAAQPVDAIDIELRGGTVPIPPECAGMSFGKTIFGTTAGDTLNGSVRADLIYVLGGDDTVTADGNADCVDGGTGIDVLDGDEHSDVLLGQAGTDTLHGGNGSDRLFGGDDADLLYGDNGNDRLFGGAGDDLLDGGSGTKDVCEGGAGADTFLNCEKVIQ